MASNQTRPRQGFQAPPTISPFAVLQAEAQAVKARDSLFDTAESELYTKPTNVVIAGQNREIASMERDYDSARSAALAKGSASYAHFMNEERATRTAEMEKSGLAHHVNMKKLEQDDLTAWGNQSKLMENEKSIMASQLDTTRTANMSLANQEVAAIKHTNQLNLDAKNAALLKSNLGTEEDPTIYDPGLQGIDIVGENNEIEVDNLIREFSKPDEDGQATNTHNAVRDLYTHLYRSSGKVPSASMMRGIMHEIERFDSVNFSDYKGMTSFKVGDSTMSDVADRYVARIKKNNDAYKNYELQSAEFTRENDIANTALDTSLTNYRSEIGERKLKEHYGGEIQYQRYGQAGPNNATQGSTEAPTATPGGSGGFIANTNGNNNNQGNGEAGFNKLRGELNLGTNTNTNTNTNNDVAVANGATVVPTEEVQNSHIGEDLSKLSKRDQSTISGAIKEGIVTKDNYEPFMRMRKSMGTKKALELFGTGEAGLAKRLREQYKGTEMPLDFNKADVPETNKLKAATKTEPKAEPKADMIPRMQKDFDTLKGKDRAVISGAIKEGVIPEDKYSGFMRMRNMIGTKQAMEMFGLDSPGLMDRLEHEYKDTEAPNTFGGGTPATNKGTVFGTTVTGSGMEESANDLPQGNAPDAGIPSAQNKLQTFINGDKQKVPSKQGSNAPKATGPDLYANYSTGNPLNTQITGNAPIDITPKHEQNYVAFNPQSPSTTGVNSFDSAGSPNVAPTESRVAERSTAVAKATRAKGLNNSYTPEEVEAIKGIYPAHADIAPSRLKMGNNLNADVSTQGFGIGDSPDYASVLKEEQANIAKFKKSTKGVKVGSPLHTHLLDGFMDASRERLGRLKELGYYPDSPRPSEEETNAMSLKAQAIFELEGWHGSADIDRGGAVVAKMGQTGRFLNMGPEAVVQDFESKLRNVMPKYDALPEYLQASILQARYRGTLTNKSKTIKLINAGKYAEAAKEFLDHDEYRSRFAKNRNDGVVKRMESTSESLQEYADYLEDKKKPKQKNSLDMLDDLFGSRSNVDSMAFGNTKNRQV